MGPVGIPCKVIRSMTNKVKLMTLNNTNYARCSLQNLAYPELETSISIIDNSHTYLILLWLYNPKNEILGLLLT